MDDNFNENDCFYNITEYLFTLQCYFLKKIKSILYNNENSRNSDENVFFKIHLFIWHRLIFVKTHRSLK